MTHATKTVRVEESHTHDEGSSVNALSNPIAAVVYYIAGLISLILAIRFLLIFLGANNTGVVNWVYQITQPFVAPFYGIFGKTALYGNARIEWESLFAIIAIGIISYAIVGFLGLFNNRTV